MENLHFEPSEGMVIVDLKQPKKRSSNIILPETADVSKNMDVLENHPLIGVVVAIGPKPDGGEARWKVGDTVLIKTDVRPRLVKLKKKDYGQFYLTDILGRSTWHEDTKLEGSFFDMLEKGR